jgi:methyl-accepting chemotaxis protein
VEQKGSQHLLNFVVLLAVIGATAVTGLLLARTMRATDHINSKVKDIARTGQGINTATDSVIQLSRTNDLAGSILGSTQPLAGDLATMLEQAKALDALSGSLDTNTGAINATVAQLLASANGMSATAGDIHATTKKVAATAAEVAGTTNDVSRSTDTLNATAKGIHAHLAELLDTSRKLGYDVSEINKRVDFGLALDRAIRIDTTNLLGQVALTQRYVACIDRKVMGTGADEHC